MAWSFTSARRGIDDSLAVFGRPALENIARGFACAARDRDVSVIPKLFADFIAQAEANLEHPDLRPGHGTDPPDHQARARQYVSISIRLTLLVAYSCESQMKRPGYEENILTRLQHEWLADVADGSKAA